MYTVTWSEYGITTVITSFTHVGCVLCVSRYFRDKNSRHARWTRHLRIRTIIANTGYYPAVVTKLFCSRLAKRGGNNACENSNDRHVVPIPTHASIPYIYRVVIVIISTTRYTVCVELDVVSKCSPWHLVFFSICTVPKVLTKNVNAIGLSRFVDFLKAYVALQSFQKIPTCWKIVGKM